MSPRCLLSWDNSYYTKIGTLSICSPCDLFCSPYDRSTQQISIEQMTELPCGQGKKSIYVIQKYLVKREAKSLQTLANRLVIVKIINLHKTAHS